MSNDKKLWSDDKKLTISGVHCKKIIETILCTCLSHAFEKIQAHSHRQSHILRRLHVNKRKKMTYRTSTIREVHFLLFFFSFSPFIKENVAFKLKVMVSQK